MPFQIPVSNPNDSLWVTLWWVAAAVLLLVGLGYGLLPLFDIYTLKSLLSFKLVWGLCALLLGGAIYWHYIDAVERRPWLILIFVALLYQGWMWGSASLATVGINVRARVMITLGLIIPGLWMGRYAIPYMLRQMPYFRYFLFFMGLMLLYFFVFNAYAIDPRSVSVGSFSGTIAPEKLFLMLCVLSGMLTSGAVFYQLEHTTNAQEHAAGRNRFFRRLNKVLIVSMGLLAIIAVLGYPFDVLTRVVDGFKRYQGVFFHPNQLGYYAGCMAVYLVGLYFYCRKHPVLPPRMVLLGLFAAAVCVMFSLSKASLAATILCAGVLLIGNLLLDRTARFNPVLLLWPVLLLLAGLGLAQGLGIIDFVDIIARRLEDGQSLLWRQQMWDRILGGDIGVMSGLRGHGFTAANARLMSLNQLVFDPTSGADAPSGIHNAFIETFYDFGLLGWSWVVGLSWTMIAMVRTALRTTDEAPEKPLLLTVVAITLFFMIVCNFEESFYSMSVPFWMLLPVLHGIIQSHQRTREAASY